MKKLVLAALLAGLSFNVFADTWVQRAGYLGQAFVSNWSSLDTATKNEKLLRWADWAADGVSYEQAASMCGVDTETYPSWDDLTTAQKNEVKACVLVKTTRLAAYKYVHTVARDDSLSSNEATANTAGDAAAEGLEDAD